MRSPDITFLDDPEVTDRYFFQENGKAFAAKITEAIGPEGTFPTVPVKLYDPEQNAITEAEKPALVVPVARDLGRGIGEPSLELDAILQPDGSVAVVDRKSNDPSIPWDQLRQPIARELLPVHESLERAVSLYQSNGQDDTAV